MSMKAAPSFLILAFFLCLSSFSISMGAGVGLLGEVPTREVVGELEAEQCFAGERNCGPSGPQEDRFFQVWGSLSSLNDLTPLTLSELAFRTSGDPNHRLALLKKGMRVLGDSSYRRQNFFQLASRHRGEVAAKLAMQSRYELIDSPGDLLNVLALSRRTGAMQREDEERCLLVLDKGLEVLEKKGVELSSGSLITYIRQFEWRSSRLFVAKRYLSQVVDLDEEKLEIICGQAWDRVSRRRNPERMTAPLEGTRLREEYDVLLSAYRLGKTCID